MAAPKLRFKEFGGDWSIKPLKNICKINQGLQIAIENRFTDDGENRYFYITNEFLREGAKNTYFIENPPRNVICDENDILMTRTGNTGQVVTDVKGAFHNNFFKIDFDRSIINKNFFIEFLKKDTTQHLILKYAGASTIPDLNHSDFYRIVMPITTIEEQAKIASFLSNVDEKISQLTQKHALLSQYKQGMMQKLFSQQIRFKADDGSEFGEWEINIIRDVFTNKSKNFNPQNEGNLPCIELEHLSQNTGKILGTIESCEQQSTKNLFEKNSVLFGKLRPYLRKFAKPKFKGVCSSEIWVLTGIKVSNDYLFQYIQSEQFSELTNIQSGSKMPRADWGVISEAEIEYPCLAEQTKIANFLSAIDQKIEVVAQQIEQAKIWKKGLLQQMFV